MVSVIRGDDNFDSAIVGNTTLGDVGTYFYSITPLGTGIGSTFSGSGITYLNSSNTLINAGLGGTWRGLGAGVSGTTATGAGTLCLRIS